MNKVHYVMVAILPMGPGLFSPPFGVSFYISCAIGKVAPERVATRIFPYLGALLLRTYANCGGVMEIDRRSSERDERGELAPIPTDGGGGFLSLQADQVRLMIVDKGAELRAVHAKAAPMITPLAHDAFSARLIAAAGFPSFNIGGSTLLAARFGLPDLGLAALGEMVAAIRDITDAVDLPCMADADDGYGDIKSVVRTVRLYERIGLGGLLLEDQARIEKQPGAAAARAVIPVEAMVERLRAGLAARATGLVVIARTDAVGLEGLDGALRRAEKYLAAGADGIFVAGLSTPEQYERVGAALRGSWNAAAMFEGGDTPFLAPRELHRLGFTQISYPMLLMQRVAGIMEASLASLRGLAAGTTSAVAHADLLSPSAYHRAVTMQEWLRLTER